jgi:GABA(A) receptor-associated protein
MNAEIERILKKYPNRIPIFVEGDFEIDKKKYLVPFDLTIGQFMYVLRKKIKLRPEEGIYLFVDGGLPSTQKRFSEIERPLGYLTIVAKRENTFG